MRALPERLDAVVGLVARSTRPSSSAPSRRLGAAITKSVTPCVRRHSFATHLLEDGYDIRTILELLEHKDVATTMIYTDVLNRGSSAVRSPLDR